MKTVLTNGCFDIITYAHIVLLDYAKGQGQFLIVGMNNDDSVRKLKGPGRPVNSQTERFAVLSALKPVDHVVIFDDLDVSGLLAEYRPDIWVKGGDYILETLNPKEVAVARDLNIQIVLCPKVPSSSTTDIIKKVYKSYETTMAQNNPSPQTGS